MPFHKINIWAENAETVSYVTFIFEPPTATQMMANYNQLKRHFFDLNMGKYAIDFNKNSVTQYKIMLKTCSCFYETVIFFLILLQPSGYFGSIPETHTGADDKINQHFSVSCLQPLN